MDNKNIGSSFDDFLEEEGILDECTETAISNIKEFEDTKEQDKIYQDVLT
ncbi:hypothetical protein [Hydrotalea sp. AMD]|nr:hypothetical protein [Hydrotalea sp. AMD]